MRRAAILLAFIVLPACGDKDEDCYPWCDRCLSDTGCQEPIDDTGGNGDNPAEGAPVLGEPQGHFEDYPNIGCALVVETPYEDSDNNLDSGQVIAQVKVNGVDTPIDPFPIDGHSAFLDDGILTFAWSAEDSSTYEVRFYVVDQAGLSSNEVELTVQPGDGSCS